MKRQAFLFVISSIVSATLLEPPGPTRSPLKVLAIILYSIVICLSLTGNISVIYILFKKIESKRVTSFMYVNLSVADLVVTFVVMPHQLQSILMETRLVWRSLRRLSCQVQRFYILRCVDGVGLFPYCHRLWLLFQHRVFPSRIPAVQEQESPCAVHLAFLDVCHVPLVNHHKGR